MYICLQKIQIYNVFFDLFQSLLTHWIVPFSVYLFDRSISASTITFQICDAFLGAAGGPLFGMFMMGGMFKSSEWIVSTIFYVYI